MCHSVTISTVAHMLFSLLGLLYYEAYSDAMKKIFNFIGNLLCKEYEKNVNDRWKWFTIYTNIVL